MPNEKSTLDNIADAIRREIKETSRKFRRGLISETEYADAYDKLRHTAQYSCDLFKPTSPSEFFFDCGLQLIAPVTPQTLPIA